MNVSVSSMYTAITIRGKLKVFFNICANDKNVSYHSHVFCVLLVHQRTCTSVCNYSIVQKQLLLVTCYARLFPKRMNAINKFYIINANSQSSFKYTFNSISTKNELDVSGTSQNVTIYKF